MSWTSITMQAPRGDADALCGHLVDLLEVTLCHVPSLAVAERQPAFAVGDAAKWRADTFTDGSRLNQQRDERATGGIDGKQRQLT